MTNSRWLLSTSLLVFLASAAFGGEAQAPAKKKILFFHGKASHGYGGHAYAPAFKMLARMLNENVPAVNGVIVGEEWPQDPAVLEGVSAISMSRSGAWVKMPFTESQKRRNPPFSSSPPLTCTGSSVRVETGSQCSSVRVARKVWNTGSTLSTCA